MQLLRDKTGRHQARVIVPLGDHFRHRLDLNVAAGEISLLLDNDRSAEDIGLAKRLFSDKYPIVASMLALSIPSGAPKIICLLVYGH